MNTDELFVDGHKLPQPLSKEEVYKLIQEANEGSKEARDKLITHNIRLVLYTVETVVAEKYQTIISRGIYNTRMKDFYDIHILITDKKEQLKLDNLIMAIKNTFKHRETELNIEEIELGLEILKTNDNLIRLWKNYQVTDTYSKDIDYETLFESLNYITKILSEEEVMI